MSRQRRERQLNRRILEQVAQAQAEGKLKPGNLYMIDVRHEGWCDLVKGSGPCNCNPEVCVPDRVPFPQEN